MGPRLFLCLTLLLCCSAPCRSDFMVLGGLSVPECSSLVQGNLQQSLEESVRSLKAAGVDHVRVMLPTEALHSPDVLSCLQSVLSSVSTSGLQPLLLLDLASLQSPEIRVPGSRPGSEQVLRSSSLSVDRALTRVFAELGDSAHTWLMLLENEEQLQLYSHVQEIFRRSFNSHGRRISLALKSDVPSLTFDFSHMPMDFLSVRVSLDCEKEAEPVLHNIKKVSAKVPVLIYDFQTKQCSGQKLKHFREQINSELNIIGCDAAAMLDLKTEESEKSVPDVASGSSKSTAVWDEFSRWSIFESKKYFYATFPLDFQWGVFSSAYQIEGGWNADGKGPSIWDTFTNGVNSIPEGGKGNVACDSYNKLDLDLDSIQGLGVKSYRFSISWSRLFPDGTTATPNQPGVDYYNNLINGLVRLRVAPVVTLYHWDLPQALQNSGGWENETMVQLFNNYADFCFKNFGDRVKFWITLNDPYSIAWKGYGSGELPPRLSVNPGVVPYRVGRILLLAHATAYRTYERVYKPRQQGVVSIALQGDWYEPLDANVPRDIEAAERAVEFRLGWFAHPIFVNGDYPDIMKFQVASKSELQGLAESRLPTFTDVERTLIKGSADVFCLNHHTTKAATFFPLDFANASYALDWDVAESELLQYPDTGIPGLRGPYKAVPWGLRRVLKYVHLTYGRKDVYVTDNAMGTERNIGTDDFLRVFYQNGYITEALKAYRMDGVRLKGYMGPPLMDAFEWMIGYIMGSGLNTVDFDGSLNRTKKYSYNAYKSVVSQNGFPAGVDEDLYHGHFRDDMMWSSATASFQIEGGWRSDGKGLSIWDKFSHTPGKVRGGDNGDLACDSYNRLEEDVKLLQTVGVKYYRFSVAWARVLPDGTAANVNEPGLQYYENLVNALTAVGIQPQVTLYHWDLPQKLQDVGGWENETIIERFTEYSDLLFSRLGPKVKRWITFNEPWIVALLGYGYGNFAPGVGTDAGRIPYNVAHNILKSHAESWHLYNDKYRVTQNGKISITLNSDWAEPRNPEKPEDRAAANRYLQFFLGWFAHPIFKGDYPPIMKEVIRDRSLAAGLLESRLPEFTPAEIQRINGTHDYFGLNHYTSVLAFPIDFPADAQVYDADRGTGTVSDWNWIESGSVWLRITPFGIRRLLKFIKEEYGDPEIIVTENGISETGPVTDLNDISRQYYYTQYINQALKAYALDGVKLVGYTAWSLMDNFEWAEGYNERFGLVYVNRSDRALPRTPKESVKTYNQIIRCNGFPPADSTHPCLGLPTDPPTTPAVNETTKPPLPTKPLPTKPVVTKPPAPLSFLGLRLSVEEAETGLNATFALLVVSCAGVVGLGVGFFMCNKRRKNDLV